jgi:alcohol dehydrogenase
LKAVALYGDRRIDVIDIPVPTPPNGWVLVKSELSGICGTDKAFYTGSYRLFKTPLIPGHEVVGRVISGSEELTGMRVVSEINFPCWSCNYCRSGLYTHCPYKKTLGIDFDGGMAEYFIAPLEALHPFKGSPEKGIFVEPLAAVLRSLSLRPPKPTDEVAVIGTGNIAWLTVQVLKKLYGARVDVIAREGSTKAGEFTGIADNVIYLEDAPRSSYDIVFEAAGDHRAINIAIELARPTGVIHTKSTTGALASVDTTLVVVKELTIIGSRCGTSREFKKAIKLLENDVVETRLDKVYDIDDAREAFEEALNPRYFKISIKP